MLQDLCTKLKDMDDADVKAFAIKRSILTEKPEVDCFIQDMKVFYSVSIYSGQLIYFMVQKIKRAFNLFPI